MFTFRCQVFLKDEFLKDEQVYDALMLEDKTFADGIVEQDDEIKCHIAKYDAGKNELLAMHVAQKVPEKGFTVYPKWQGTKDNQTSIIKTYKMEFQSIKVKDYDEITYTTKSGNITKWVFTEHVEESQVPDDKEQPQEESEEEYMPDSEDEQAPPEILSNKDLALQKAKKAEQAVQAEAAKKAAKAQAKKELDDKAAAEEEAKKELEEQAAMEAAAQLEQMSKDQELYDTFVQKLKSTQDTITAQKQELQDLVKQQFQEMFISIDSIPKSIIPDPDVMGKNGKTKNVLSFDVFKSLDKNVELYNKLHRMATLRNTVEGKNTRNFNDDVRRAFTEYCNYNPDKKDQFDGDLKRFQKEANKPKSKDTTEEQPSSSRKAKTPRTGFGKSIKSALKKLRPSSA